MTRPISSSDWNIVSGTHRQQKKKPADLAIGVGLGVLNRPESARHLTLYSTHIEHVDSYTSVSYKPATQYSSELNMIIRRLHEVLDSIPSLGVANGQPSTVAEDGYTLYRQVSDF